MRRVTIEVPATVGGLGPGAGHLGLALDIVQTVEVEIDAESGEVEGPENLCRAYQAWPEGTLPGARFTFKDPLPPDGGLGGDVATLVAGLAAGAYAREQREGARPRIISLAVEQGADAGCAAAAVQGGLITAYGDGEQIRANHVASHLLMDVALFLPASPLDRPDRSADPGRLAYLIAALTWGRWERIGPAMQDDSLPAPGAEILRAALDAGAYGAFVSPGSSSLVALSPYRKGDEVCAAMEVRAHRVGLEGTGRVTAIRESGLRVAEVKEQPEGDATA